jgi:hypothetical protein
VGLGLWRASRRLRIGCPGISFDNGRGYVEGDAHHEGCGVGYVECSETFCAEDGCCAFEDGSEGTAVDLHSLFDYWN